MPERVPSCPPPAVGPCRVGVDLAVVDDVAASLATFGDRYARRLFTAHELTSPEGGRRSAESLAARFAAKEAVVKVLAPEGPRPAWRDIEVRQRPEGACDIALTGRAARLAGAAGLGHLGVSLSHEAGLAVAVVVGAGAPPGTRTDRTAAGCVDGEQPAAADPGGGRRPPRPAPDGPHETRRVPMTTADTTTRVRTVLADHARLPVALAAVGDEDDLFQAGMTSHASVNVMLALEDEFDVEFPESMLRKSTFSSIAALVRALDALAVSEEVVA